MKFQQLESLATVADTGSFYKAAEKMLFPQQLLQKYIEQLEQELGHPLIYQEGTSVYLTESGQCVTRHARRLLEERNAIYAELDATIEY